MRTGYSKSEKMDPRVSKSEAKGTKSEPKGTKSEPKGSQREAKVSRREPKVSQREPKVSQREPKGSQKWAKGRPKCIKKSVFGKDREKGAKRLSASRWNGWLLGAIFHQKTMKKSMRKSMPKKSWKIMKKRCKNDAILDWKSSKNWSCAKSA